VLGCAWALASVTPASAAEWLAGDLHVHTTYSHDSYGGPGDDNTGLDDANTVGLSVGGQFALAGSRGLSYLAITDHNDIRSQQDPGFGFGGVSAVPGYENSLKTHAQMLGARRIYPNGDKGLAATLGVAEALRRDGGVFQVNHPSSPNWVYGYDVPAETSEVWNLPWYYQPPFPAAADNDRALRFWQGWLDRGAKVGVAGGSDSHWAYTSPVQGVGQPTTWVYARDRSVAGILAGLREGRTFLSHQPPAYAGPQVFLEGDGDGDGRFEAMVGDTVPPGSRLRARVVGAPGAMLRLAINGGREAFAPVQVSGSEFEHRFIAPAAATWIHAQLYGEDVPVGRQAGCAAIPSDDLTGSFTYCTNRVAMLGLTSAIFLRPPAASAERPATVAAPSRARLRLPRSCVRSMLRATVSGRGIERVTARLDGRTLRGVRRHRAGRMWVITADASRLRAGRHRLTARARLAGRSPLTLRGSVRRCATRAGNPRFAG